MAQIGLVSISFRALSADDIIRLCSEAKLPCIEWGSDIHAVPENREALLHIRELQSRSGISCSSYGTYFKLGKSDPQEFSRYLDASDILGTDTLRLWCGVKGSADYMPEKRAQVVSDAKRVAKEAAARGKTVLLECHPKTLTDDTDSSLRLMQEVDSPAFRMMWQPNQYKSLEYNLDSARRLAPFVGNVHVFQWDEKHHYPLSDGTDIWRRYFRLLPDAAHYLLEFVPGNDPAVLAREADSLRMILAGL